MRAGEVGSLLHMLHSGVETIFKLAEQQFILSHMRNPIVSAVSRSVPLSFRT